MAPRTFPFTRVATVSLLLVVLGTACGGTSGDAPFAGGGADTAQGDASHNGDAGGDGGAFDPASCAVGTACANRCCGTDEFCAKGERCAPKQGTCANADDCSFDSYCENGQCIPYGVPPDKVSDDSCKRTVDITAITPAVQCTWTGPPAGDAHPANVQVMATPVVIDFNFDDDPKTLAPSIVFPTFTNNSYSGVLRVIAGSDCSQQFSIDAPADAVDGIAAPAVADLDGDGRAEIIAIANNGGLLAFKYDSGAKTFVRMWHSGTCNGGVPPIAPDGTGAGTWSSPSVHDLDDDGVPEIIHGGTVYGANGCIRSSKLGFPPYGQGYIPVIADVDEDGKMELVLGNALYEWSAGDWVAKSTFKGTGLPAGQVAVGDLGNFPIAALGNKDVAEIVVISGGQARVQTVEGKVVFGPFAVPGGGTSGPPTIADFDGDGHREFATAGAGGYSVFDLDCVAGGNAANCNGTAKTNGVLWTLSSQDASSGVTGSSVFDFDANGSAEAVYADECYLRIYEGKTGNVLYSVSRASATTYENPVIADVDGDYRTEIVSSVNDWYSISCPATDPHFPSAKYKASHGIIVLRDEQDRWAASRPVWNQHAYAVTNVGDHGEIPKTSATKVNWRQPGLNNFRQNTQGDLQALGEPDLTVGGDVGAVQCSGTKATIQARVCNRGTLPMVSGTEVAFYDGSATGPLLCSAPIPQALGVGECSVVGCQAELGTRSVDVYVLADPKALAEECHEKNNGAVYRGVSCGQVPR